LGDLLTDRGGEKV